MVMVVYAPAVPNTANRWSISHVSRCAETGALAFVFERDDGFEVQGEVVVSYYVEKGYAFVEYVRLERLVRAPLSFELELAAWVHEHEDEVLGSALEAA